LIFINKYFMIIKDKIQPDGEYIKQLSSKKIIVIHHTAGSHRADWTIDGWNTDKTASGAKLRIGTAYVIGGLDRNGTDKDNMNGIVYRAFDDKYASYHLGLKTELNNQITMQSVAIEICNYGWVNKTSSGKFLNYVNNEISASEVIDLGFEFRGSRYWHKYTDAQIATLKELLIKVSTTYGIDLKKGMMEFGDSAFNLNQNALHGAPGLWSHVNYRQDKFDCSPQPNLIQMLKSL
jgi:hypothetical protein